MTAKKEKDYQYQNQGPNKWRGFKVSVVLCLVITVIAVGAIVYLLLLNSVSVRSLIHEEYEVGTSEEFVSQLKANSSMDEKLGAKKVYTLTDDITLSEKEVGELHDLKFFGTLCGNGHTVKVEEGVALTQPLIARIAGGAKIERITFADLTLTSAAGKDVALFGANNGILCDIRMQNVTLSTESLKITDEAPSSLAALAVRNESRGEISRFVADIKVLIPKFVEFTGSEGAAEKSEKWKCAMGGVVAQNYFGGKISDVVLDMEYPDSFTVLHTDVVPMRYDVGYIAGSYSLGWVEDFNRLCLLGSSKVKMLHDINELSVKSDRITIWEEADFIKEFKDVTDGSYKEWDRDVWTIGNAGLPFLKAEENVK